MKPILILLLLMGLAACSHAPQVVGVPPPGIDYRLDRGSTDQHDQQADQYCRQYGKHAQLQSLTRDGDAGLAEYACS
jgi:hypothetical protein